MKGVIRTIKGRTVYEIDGMRVSRARFYRVFRPVSDAGAPGASLLGWKPLSSEAAAVHPDQIEEAREDARRLGVPTEFDPEGRPIFTSRSHRRAYLRAYGFHDRDGGYGDG
jgi:hypothetical protein